MIAENTTDCVGGQSVVGIDDSPTTRLLDGQAQISGDHYFPLRVQQNSGRSARGRQATIADSKLLCTFHQFEQPAPAPDPEVAVIIGNDAVPPLLRQVVSPIHIDGLIVSQAAQ